jgi:hypothetical protein
MFSGRRTVRARRVDYSRLTQWTSRSGLYRGVFNFCTTDHPGIGSGPFIVLTRGVASLHNSLCACADRSARVDGPSASAKMELGTDCVFGRLYYGLSSVSARTVLTPGWRTVRPWRAGIRCEVTWSVLRCIKFLGLGLSNRVWWTV